MPSVIHKQDFGSEQNKVGKKKQGEKRNPCENVTNEWAAKSTQQPHLA